MDSFLDYPDHLRIIPFALEPIQATQECNGSVQLMPLYLTARSTHTKPPHLRMSFTEPKIPSPC